MYRIKIKRMNYIAVVIFGISSVVCICIAIYFFMRMFKQKYVFLSEIENLEELVYKDTYNLLAVNADSMDNQVLEYMESPLQKTTVSEFQSWKGTNFKGSVIFFDKSFRVNLRYCKYGPRKNVTVKEENWFEALCYAQIKDDKLMDIGVLMINNSLSAVNDVKNFYKSYSDDNTENIFILCIMCIMTVVFFIVSLILFLYRPIKQ